MGCAPVFIIVLYYISRTCTVSVKVVRVNGMIVDSPLASPPRPHGAQASVLRPSKWRRPRPSAAHQTPPPALPRGTGRMVEPGTRQAARGVGARRKKATVAITHHLV